MSRPTLKTLARDLGLSVTTVSRALKEAEDVRGETIARVKERARALGYRPNLRGVSLRTGRTNRICTVLPVPAIHDLGDVGFVTLVEGMMLALKGTLYSLAVVPQLPEEDELDPIRKVVETDLADGLILTRTQPQDPRVKYLLEKNFPFVTFGRTELFTPFPSLDIDHEGMMEEATARLIGLGHRRIALVNPPQPYTYSGHRLAGYRRALRDGGVPFDPALVHYCDLGARAGHQVALEDCRTAVPPTAYICANEMSVFGLLSGLREGGRQVGTDVAVVGFDGTAMTALCNPPVTTYFASLPDAGRRLAELLLAALGGADPATLQEVWQARLIIRQGDAAPGHPADASMSHCGNESSSVPAQTGHVA